MTVIIAISFYVGIGLAGFILGIIFCGAIKSGLKKLWNKIRGL